MVQTNKQRTTRKNRKPKYVWLPFYRKVYKDIKPMDRQNVLNYTKDKEIINKNKAEVINYTYEIIDTGIIDKQLYYAKRNVDIILGECCIMIAIVTDKNMELNVSLRVVENKLIIADFDAHKCMAIRVFIERLMGFVFREILLWNGMEEISGSVKKNSKSVCTSLYVEVFREAGFAVTFSKGMCHFYLAV
jgi:hypothetical protein